MPRQDTCNKHINATGSSSPDRTGNGGDGCDSEFDESEGYVPYGLYEYITLANVQDDVDNEMFDVNALNEEECFWKSKEVATN
ncbi:hypothetical protein Tco_0798166 [Tanacetum coccineum]